MTTENDEPGYTFTVFTPTFNRAHTLPRVFESLDCQTFRDFEWLVVDDGSTDDTRSLIEEWRRAMPFPIRYLYQRNSGKHVADNLATRSARGRFIATLDSDDWYLPIALERFLAVWSSIPVDDQDGYVGVAALCSTPDGKLIGRRFPKDVLDTTYRELSAKLGVTGDKAGFGRTEVVRDFPFPVFEGETLILESLVYGRIARSYRLRCVNEILMIKEYQAAGLSADTRSDFASNPRTSKLYFLEQLLVGDGGEARLLSAYANHTRFALHAMATGQSFRDVPSKLRWLLTFPVALLVHLRDRIRLRRR